MPTRTVRCRGVPHAEDVPSSADHFVALTMDETPGRRGSHRCSRLLAAWMATPSKGNCISIHHPLLIQADVAGSRFEQKEQLRKLLQSAPIQIGLFVLLSYVLFVNNVATLARASDDFITPLNITLIIGFGVFCLEMSINFWTASKQDALYMAMELIGTFSILLEVTWIAASLGLDHSIEKENVSKTAIITSRAGRVTRMVRLIRFVRALKIFIMIRRYFARRVEDDGKERSIAPSSIGNCLNDRISLLAAFLVMMTMMVVSLSNPPDSDEMNGAFLLTLATTAGENSGNLTETLVQEIKNYVDRKGNGAVLRKLMVGDVEWNWYDAGCCSIDRDRLTLSREGTPPVCMELDISHRNITIAWLEIFLGLAVIIELFVFVALLHRNTSRILIAPLERIFSMIKQNAHMIVSALDVNDNGQNGESSEIDTIEAAISKMSKLVGHISPSGQQGTHVLKNYMLDENTSADTKAWLHDFAIHAKSASFKRTKNPDSTHLMAIGLDRNLTLARAISEDDRKQAFHISTILSAVDCDALHSWEFDVTKLSSEELYGALCLMFEDLGLASFADGFGTGSALVPMERLWEFVKQVSGYYQNVPYHNFFHCCDVAHATFRFIKLVERRTDMSPLEKFALMIASICHDMDHPGLQNSFLVQTKHPLARLYNDKSVLENHHISCLYSLVAEHPEADVFYYLDDTSWKEVRKIIIESILHTDMVKHFGTVSKAEIFYELHSAEIHSENCVSLFEDEDDRLFLFALILHCADISNPVRPLSISEKYNSFPNAHEPISNWMQRWADNVLNEFFQQGDKERQNGLTVSPLCDRDSTSRPASQINFLEFVIAPLYFHVVRIFPDTRSTMMHLKDNRRFWEKVYLAELTAKNAPNCEEEISKAKKRHEAFLHKYKEVFEQKQHSPNSTNRLPSTQD